MGSPKRPPPAPWLYGALFFVLFSVGFFGVALLLAKLLHVRHGSTLDRFVDVYVSIGAAIVGSPFAGGLGFWIGWVRGRRARDSWEMARVADGLDESPVPARVE